MSRYLRGLVCAMLLGAVVCLPASAGLLEYVAKPDPEYTWSKAGEQMMGATKVTDLAMTSQVWQGIPWKHTIRIFSPPDIKYPDAALLLITGGNPGKEDVALGTVISQAIQAPIAILFNLPNQPLYGGKTEDALIAYTFTKYLETGDDTWPLLLPMAKSAVRAMDALQAFAKQEWKRELTTFVVTGASKRGWTTWLTGAVDQKRVKGIAPMVIDTLNMPAQMPHQLETWGSYSQEISDYTERGLQALLGAEEGKTLVKIVDPYSYRDRITMPKLIINGANDAYWVIDALNFYWDDLVGPKWVLYVPNSGHSLGDRTRLISSLSAFFRSVAAGESLPRMSWRYGTDDGKLTLTITADPKPTAARVWVNKSDDMDFRDNRWELAPMSEQGEAFVGVIEKPADKNLAMFGEAEFSAGGRSFTLSTQVRVVPRG